MRLLVIILSLVFCSSLHAKRIFVDNTAISGLNNGSTWVNAYLSLDTAFAKSQIGDTIWVAAGRYYPSQNSSLAFSLPKGTSVFGGFSKTEAYESERKLDMYKTYLDGDVGVKGKQSDNSNRLLNVIDADILSVLDGFNLVGAYNSNMTVDGGALYIFNSKINVRNCNFENNYVAGSGAAVLIKQAKEAGFYDCFFKNNKSGISTFGYGGAVYSVNSMQTTFQSCQFINNNTVNAGGACQFYNAVTLIDCNFKSNKANYSGAVQMSITNRSTSYVTRCIFSGNSSIQGSGAAFGCYLRDTASLVVSNSLFVGNYAKSGSIVYTDMLWSGIPLVKLNNCTFSGNNNGTGSAVLKTIDNSKISNSIFWNNGSGMSVFFVGDKLGSPFVSSCLMDGGFAGIPGVLNGMNKNPNFEKFNSPSQAPFTDSALNYQVKIGSPVIDAGDSVFKLQDGQLDLKKSKRVFSNNVDLGVYESASSSWRITLKDSLYGGSSTGQGLYPNDSLVRLKAKSLSCNYFYGWMENNVLVSTDSVFEFKASKNRKITAVYPFKQFNINVLVKNGILEGSIQGAGTYYCYDSVKIITAIPNACYRFVEWRENGFPISTQTNLNVKLKGNREFEAVFEKTTSTLTLSTQPANGGTVKGAGTFNCKSPTQVGAKANPGFVFFAWLDMANGYVVSKDSNYSFSINSDRELRAWFQVNTGIESHFKSLGFYPNPCHDFLNLQFEIRQYQIFNVEGQLIKSGKEQAIDVKSLLPGIYLLEVMDAFGDIQRIKFVKE